jgi:histone H3/H4
MARTKSHAVKRSEPPKGVEKKIQKVDQTRKPSFTQKKPNPKKPVKKLTFKKCSPQKSPSQKSIPDQAEFGDIFNDVTANLTAEVKFQNSALKELQDSTEQFLNQWMEDGKLCAKISGQSTPSIRDLKLARRIRD